MTFKYVVYGDDSVIFIKSKNQVEIKRDKFGAVTDESLVKDIKPFKIYKLLIEYSKQMHVTMAPKKTKMTSMPYVGIVTPVFDES